MIVPDMVFFGKYIPAVKESDQEKPSIVYFLSAITYGDIIVEYPIKAPTETGISVGASFMLYRFKHNNTAVKGLPGFKRKGDMIQKGAAAFISFAVKGKSVGLRFI